MIKGTTSIQIYIIEGICQEEHLTIACGIQSTVKCKDLRGRGFKGLSERLKGIYYTIEDMEKNLEMCTCF